MDGGCRCVRAPGVSGVPVHGWVHTSDPHRFVLWFGDRARHEDGGQQQHTCTRGGDNRRPSRGPRHPGIGSALSMRGMPRVILHQYPSPPRAPTIAGTLAPPCRPAPGLARLRSRAAAAAPPRRPWPARCAVSELALPGPSRVHHPPPGDELATGLSESPLVQRRLARCVPPRTQPRQPWWRELRSLSDSLLRVCVAEGAALGRGRPRRRRRTPLARGCGREARLRPIRRRAGVAGRLGDGSARGCAAPRRRVRSAGAPGSAHPLPPAPPLSA